MRINNKKAAMEMSIGNYCNYCSFNECYGFRVGFDYKYL
jgi:hypothetical protein